jgi:formate hydrogenlyase subunit 6/NADH:ubiquinone oxidoreductase subunit I
MNILKLIAQNLRKGTVSFRLPHRHECTSNEYRGLIHNDETRCVGCGSCAYVCPTAAIEVTRGAGTYTWSYDPGKCTFCTRCLDRCRLHTLSFESKLPPLYSHRGELKVVYTMEKKKPAPRPVAAAAPAASSTVPIEKEQAAKVPPAATVPAAVSNPA